MSNKSGGNLTNSDTLHRELHDGLCQSITCSLFYAQNLRSRLQKSESLDESVLNLADKVVEAATNAATDLRAVLKKLASEREKGRERSSLVFRKFIIAKTRPNRSMP